MKSWWGPCATEVTRKGFWVEGPTAANDDDDGWRPDFFPNERVVCSHGISHTTLRRLSTYAAALLISSARFFFLSDHQMVPLWQKIGLKKFQTFPFHTATHLFGEREYTKDYLGISRMPAMPRTSWFRENFDFLFSRWMGRRQHDISHTTRESGADAVNTWTPRYSAVVYNSPPLLESVPNPFNHITASLALSQ